MGIANRPPGHAARLAPNDSRRPLASRRSSESVARSTSARTSSGGSRKRPSTHADTISGSVESGRPTPTRMRRKSGPPSSCLSDLRPL